MFCASHVWHPEQTRWHPMYTNHVQTSTEENAKYDINFRRNVNINSNYKTTLSGMDVQGIGSEIRLEMIRVGLLHVITQITTAKVRSQNKLPIRRWQICVGWSVVNYKTIRILFYIHAVRNLENKQFPHHKTHTKTYKT